MESRPRQAAHSAAYIRPPRFALVLQKRLRGRSRARHAGVLAKRLDHVVWVVEDDAVAALASADTADRGRELEPGHVVLDAPLAGLDHEEPIAP
jgi:hypothetical protein